MSLPATAFLFLRHGQTDWNLAGRMQGHTDIPLNHTGRAQAAQAALALQRASLTRIVSSPLSRARETAEIIAAALQIPLVFDEELKERSFGSFEGLITKDVRAQHGLRPEQSITDILPPDAEQWPETKTRANFCVSRLLREYPEDVLLLVSHGAFFRALYEALGGPRLEAKNATPYHFTPPSYPNTAWELMELSDSTPPTSSASSPR